MALLLYLLPWLAYLQLALLYPTDDEGDPLLRNYRLRLAKRDSVSPFKESLLSALLLSEIPRGTWNVRTLHRDYSLDVLMQEFQRYNLDILGLQEIRWTGKDSQNNRKKAVDSTFIRFGRSSLSEDHHHNSPSLTTDSSGSYDFDYYSENGRRNRAAEDGSDAHSALSSAEVSDDFLRQIRTSPTSSSSDNHFRSNQHFQNGCKLTHNSDLMRALLGNACVRAFQKVKRENVNDTFIRFGKRDSTRRLTRGALSDQTQYSR